MEVIRARIAAAEELAPGYALLSTMLVTGGAKRSNVVPNVTAPRVAAEHVQHRLRGAAGNRGTTHVLERDGKRRIQELADPRRFGDEQLRPHRIIDDDANHSAVQ